MEKNEIKELYSMLNNIDIKSFHEYKLEIKDIGINLYPINNSIYILHSLIRKVLKVTPSAIFYVNFKYKYIRII